MYGAVTDGKMWMFFAFTPGPDGVGGTCEQSPLVIASSPDARAAITGVITDLVRVDLCGIRRLAHSMFCLYLLLCRFNVLQ